LFADGLTELKISPSADMGAVTQWPTKPNEIEPDAAILSAAFETCHERLAVVEDERILYANSAFTQALGFSSSAKLQGRILSELVPEVPSATQSARVNFRVHGRNLSVVSTHKIVPNKAKNKLPSSLAMETMGRLVSGVAHDFNNLLTGMLLYCDLLIAGLEGNARLQNQVREMRTAGQQGGALIQQLLTLARHQVSEPRAISWNDTISGMQPFLQRLIGEDIELGADLDVELEPVEMDPAQMQQTILNLVLNARDAMPDGGKVTIATRNCRESSLASSPVAAVEFSVSDTGCGMDEETRAHIFEPFFSTKGPGRGNGLGLATVHNIVAKHGGTIQVESTPGSGTKVGIRLPRLRPNRIHKSEGKKR
jgi:signal transduction histidine kinase